MPRCRPIGLAPGNPGIFGAQVPKWLQRGVLVDNRVLILIIECRYILDSMRYLLGVKDWRTQGFDDISSLSEPARLVSIPVEHPDSACRS